MLKMLKSDNPPPTAAEIAAKIRKVAELQLAETTHRQLRERRDAIASEMRDLISANRNGRHDRRIHELSEEERGLSAEASKAKAIATGLRTARAEKIYAALAAHRSAAAVGILTALEELRRHLADLDDAHREVMLAGGEAVHTPTMRATAHIEAAALKYAK